MTKKLVCVLVGVAGSVFPVDIDENDTVSVLKEAIKKEKSDIIKCDAHELQLYLVKTGDTWLNRADAETLTIKDLSNFTEMGSSAYLNSDLASNEEVIHVLVVVPTRRESKEKNRNTFSQFMEKLVAEYVEEFKWEVELTEEQQREKYRKYIEDNIGDILTKANLCVFDVANNEDLLTVQVPGHDIELAGTTDLLILSSIVKEFPFEVDTLPNARMLIEVKKEVEGRHTFQVISELMALDLLVRQPVAGLLTNLQNFWKFFWIGENSIETTILKRPTHAFKMIKKLLEDSSNDDADETLPYVQEGAKKQKLEK